MIESKREGRHMSVEEFDSLFASLNNGGRWGPDDERGTVNYLTADKVCVAAALVRRGRSVTLSLPINTIAGPDNPNPALYYVNTTHDVDSGAGDIRFATDFLGMQFQGDCHTHIDARCVAVHCLLYSRIPPYLLREPPFRTCGNC